MEDNERYRITYVDTSQQGYRLTTCLYHRDHWPIAIDVPASVFSRGFEKERGVYVSPAAILLVEDLAVKRLLKEETAQTHEQPS